MTVEVVAAGGEDSATDTAAVPVAAAFVVPAANPSAVVEVSPAKPVVVLVSATALAVAFAVGDEVFTGAVTLGPGALGEIEAVSAPWLPDAGFRTFTDPNGLANAERVTALTSPVRVCVLAAAAALTGFTGSAASTYAGPARNAMRTAVGRAACSCMDRIGIMFVSLLVM